MQSKLLSIEFDKTEGFQQALQESDINLKVSESLQNRYQCNQVDVAEPMNSLLQVGKCIQVAYSGSKGHSCNEHVVQIMCEYQTLIKDSRVVLGSFVQTCYTSLKYHKFALLILQKDQADVEKKALKFLCSCSTLAGEMSKKCDNLINLSKKLCDEAKEALISASKDHCLRTNERNDVEKMIAELEAKETNLKQRKVDLERLVKEQEKIAQEANKNADKAESRKHLLEAVSSIAAPVFSLATRTTRLISSFNPLARSQSEELAEKNARVLGVLIKKRNQLTDEKAKLVLLQKQHSENGNEISSEN